MLYDQGYFYGKMSDYGLKLRNNSGRNDGIFDRLPKRQREFDNSLVAEYTEYDESSIFCYIGAIRIDQGTQDARYSTLHHIFVPAEPTDINNPYTYIRYFYPYYYNFSKRLTDPIDKMNIPDISLDYHELLSYCGLDGDENRKRFAKLLELMYSVIFMEKTVAVVLPDRFFDFDMQDIPDTISKEEKPKNCYQIAAALMLLLHLTVPDCFSRYNEIKDLRAYLKYSIVKNTSNKRGFCFISSSNAQYGVNCELFDFDSNYNDFDISSFYYSLAGEAQSSLDTMHDFLQGLCSVAGVEKFSCRQPNTRHLALNGLLKAYGKSVPIRTILNAESLITWDKYINIINTHFANANDNIYLKEYVGHLAKFGGKEQIPDDEHLKGFWNALNPNHADNAKNVLFLLDECRSNETLISFLENIIDNSEILLCFSVYDESPFKRIVECISNPENGLYYLEKCTGLMKRASASDLPIYSDIIADITDNAITLFSVTRSKRKWLDIMINSGLWDETWLQRLVYNNTLVYSNAEWIKTQKGYLDVSQIYDMIVWKKLFDTSYEKLSECFNQDKKCFEQDKNFSNVQNRNNFAAWNDICDSLAKPLKDTKVFHQLKKEAETFYRKYDIANTSSFDGIEVYFSNDTELQKCCIEHLGVIIDNDLNDLNETNQNDLKKILAYIKRQAGSNNASDAFDGYVNNIRDQLIWKTVSEKQFSLLKFIDSLNDNNLRQTVWNSIPIDSFPYIEEEKYNAPQPLLKNIRLYLYDMYSRFDKDIAGSILKLTDKEKFRDNIQELKDNISVFIALDAVMEKCKASKTSMKNYIYLAYILDDDRIYRTIYNNFNSQIPACEKANNENVHRLAKNMYSYAYVKFCISKEEAAFKAEDILSNIEQIGYENLDDEESKQFQQMIAHRVNRKFTDKENKMFEPNCNIFEAFDKLKVCYSYYSDIFSKYADILYLVRLSQCRLCERITDLMTDDIPYETKMDYISCANELELANEEQIKFLNGFKVDIEEGRIIQEENSQNSLADIYEKLQNRELSITDNLWNRIQTLINTNMEYFTFNEYNAGYELIKIFRNSRYNVSDAFRVYQDKNLEIQNSGSFDKFWWLYVDCRINMGYIRNFWEVCDLSNFKELYDVFPPEYEMPAMIRDICLITDNQEFKIIKSPLFALYKLMQDLFGNKSGISSDDFDDIDLMIKKCTIVSRVSFLDNNIEMLKEVLLLIIRNKAEELTKSCNEYAVSDAFRYYFGFADNASKNSRGNTYFHIDIVNELLSTKMTDFLNKRRTEFLWDSLSPSYRELPVFMKVLKIWIIQDFIKKYNKGHVKTYNGQPSNESYRGINADRLTKSGLEQNLFRFIREIYKDDDGTVMDTDTKNELKEVFKSDIERLEKAKRTGSILSPSEKKYLSQIKELITGRKATPCDPREVKLLAEELL